MECNPYEGLSEDALDTCVRRMARTLASKPRNPKLRAYLISLNERERKTAAQIEAELRAQARAAEIVAEEKERRAIEGKERFDVGKAAARKVIERAAARQVRRSITDMPEIRRVRKQRISPLAPKTERRHQTKHCRRASRFQRNISTGQERPARVMEKMRALRIELHRAQGGICGICGHELDHRPERGSLDHVIPHSMLSREDGNYVLTHGDCNGDKTNDVPTGCELVFLLFVNCKLGLQPQVF